MSVSNVLPNAITISWPQLDSTIDGGDTPYYFEVEHFDSSTSAWVKMIENEAIGTKLDYTHQLPAGQLFTADSFQEYRVLPKNLVGWGLQYSDVLSVQADTIPGKMNTPVVLSVSYN